MYGIYRTYSLASFQGDSHKLFGRLQYANMEIWSCAMMSGRQRVDTQVVVSDGEF